MRDAGLALYRKLLRAVKDFPVAPVARKLRHNIREVFEVHKAEQDPSNIERLHSDGGAALRVIAFLRQLPQEDFDMIFRQHFKEKQRKE